MAKAKLETTPLSLALQWRSARADRLAAQKEVDKLETEEKKLKQQVMELLRASPNKSASDGDRLFQLVTKDEPEVKDWPTLYKHIKKTGQFELLHRRLNPTAVKERWELKEKVPGVGSIPVETLSDTQAKG